MSSFSPRRMNPHWNLMQLDCLLPFLLNYSSFHGLSVDHFKILVSCSITAECRSSAFINERFNSSVFLQFSPHSPMRYATNRTLFGWKKFQRRRVVAHGHLISTTYSDYARLGGKYKGGLNVSGGAITTSRSGSQIITLERASSGAVFQLAARNFPSSAASSAAGASRAVPAAASRAAAVPGGTVLTAGGVPGPVPSTVPKVSQPMSQHLSQCPANCPRECPSSCPKSVLSTVPESDSPGVPPSAVPTSPRIGCPHRHRPFDSCGATASELAWSRM